jgi:hypothetical protein
MGLIFEDYYRALGSLVTEEGLKEAITAVSSFSTCTSGMMPDLIL